MSGARRLSDPLLRVQTDERLAALAAHGGERAFAILVERHRTGLVAFARRLGANGGAEDVVQQALLQAWSALGRGARVDHVRAWLHQIVRNAAIRAAARTPDGDELPATLVAATETADEVEMRQQTQHLLSEIERLPPRQREALLRLAVAGHSGAEVGREMNLEPNAVRQLAHRARTRLRVAMGAMVPWPVAVWAATGGGGGAFATAGADRMAEIAGGVGLAGGASLTAGVVKLGAVAGTTVAVALGATGIAHHHRHHATATGAGTTISRAAAAVPAAAAAALTVTSPLGDRHGGRTTAGEDRSRHGGGNGETSHGGRGGDDHGGSSGSSGSSSSGRGGDETTSSGRDGSGSSDSGSSRSSSPSSGSGVSGGGSSGSDSGGRDSSGRGSGSGGDDRGSGDSGDGGGSGSGRSSSGGDDLAGG